MEKLKPIFVGGTGRSGSTVTGYLLGSHPLIWNTKPREVRFITDPGGLLDLVQGRGGRIHPSIDPTAGPSGYVAYWARRVRATQQLLPVAPASFMRSMYGEWWERKSPEGEDRGLHRGIDPTVFHEALQRFDESVRVDPTLAAQRLVHDVLDPPSRSLGADAWADTTPQNAENAHRLVQLLPEAKVIFMIRDGRDTCASVLQKQWGPMEAMTALEWWRRASLRSVKSMAQMPSGSGLTIRLGRLIDTDREATLRRLFDFIGYDITPGVRTFFDSRMSPQKGHVRRWQRDIPAEALPAFERRYGEIWDELTSIGLDLPPI